MPLLLLAVAAAAVSLRGAVAATAAVVDPVSYLAKVGSRDQRRPWQGRARGGAGGGRGLATSYFKCGGACLVEQGCVSREKRVLEPLFHWLLRRDGSVHLLPGPRDPYVSRLCKPTPTPSHPIAPPTPSPHRRPTPLSR